MLVPPVMNRSNAGLPAEELVDSELAEGVPRVALADLPESRIDSTTAWHVFSLMRMLFGCVWSDPAGGRRRSPNRR